MKVVIRVMRGAYAGREFVFERHDTLLVGRAEDAHISIPGDKAFSRNHFLIEVSPPRCFVRDLGSSNGTYVNRVKIQETMLKHGDVIAAGETRLAVIIEATPPGTATPAKADPSDLPTPETPLVPGEGAPLALDEEEVTDQVDLLTATQAVRELKQLGLKSPAPAAAKAAPKKTPPPAADAQKTAQKAKAAADAKVAWLQHKAALKNQAGGNAADPAAADDSAAAERAAAGAELVGDARQGGRAPAVHAENSPALEEDVPIEADPRLQIPGYRIGRLMAQGGMGSIYRGVEINTGRPVAVKFVSPQMEMDEAVMKMFQREVQILSKLQHPNIVNLLEHGRQERLDYFVMELIEGVNLEQYVRRRSEPLAPEVAVELAGQALDALHYAHYCNVVHRDIKPGNFMIEMRDGRPFARLLDFGLAKNYEEAGSLTMTGDFKGTLYFVPPEQIKNTKAVGPRSDLFSLGGVLYFMLTRTFLYETKKERVADLLRAVLEAKVIPITDRGVKLPPALVAAVNKALAKDPAKRYQSAAEMKHALEIAL